MRRDEWRREQQQQQRQQEAAEEVKAALKVEGVEAAQEADEV